MAMKVTFGNDARKQLAEGVDITAQAVVATLGPRGLNVAIEQPIGPPKVIHDGVSVAKEVYLADPLQNMGAQLVRVAASQTNDVAGDGTTTSTLLANTILKLGMKHISNGANAMILKKGIDKAIEAVVSEIKKLSTPVKDGDIEKVATISAQDARIGSLVTQALSKLGKDGVVSVEESRKLEMTLNYKEGMELDSGYISPYFSTDADKLETEIEDPYILITDKKIFALAEMIPFLDQIVKANKKVVVIAEDVIGETLSTLIENRLRGTMIPLAVKAPGIGENRTGVLEDIAILTGGTVITKDGGRKLQSVRLEDCGRADRVWADNNSFRIIGGKGDQDKINQRVTQLRNSFETEQSEVEKERLKKRLAKLTNGIAVIKVGATTEVEMRDKKERVIDAVSATKAAMEEGVVPGGGVTYLKCRQTLLTLKEQTADEEERMGIDIVYHSLAEPIRMLAKNSGEKPDVVLMRVESSTEKNFGLDCLTRTYGDMVEKGIIDSTKVVRSAIENAASVGTMILTTEVLISHIPEKQQTTQ